MTGSRLVIALALLALMIPDVHAGVVAGHSDVRPGLSYDDELAEHRKVQPQGAGEAVASALRACEGQHAEFTQRFRPKGFKKDQIERGTVLFGTLPRMRWIYSEPEEKVFVFDGTTSWLYIAADKQVTIHRVSGEDRAKLPFFVLSDASRAERDFRIATRGNRTTLEAKAKGSMLQTIALETSGGRLIRLEYTDAQGNALVFEFAKHTPQAADSSAFSFTPPAGVDVVDE